jgi:prophage maintenance system killer protein
MRWDNLDDIPAGGMIDAPSNANPEGLVRHTPWQQGPGMCPYHGTPLEIVRVYNDGSTYYSCLQCQRADKEEWAESRRPLAASDYLDQSLKVIYDFENDEIILGSKAQAALMPTGKIVGEYTEEDVVLYDHHEAWLNANYFKKLWGHSFPDRPLRTLFLEEDGEHRRISATLEDHAEDTEEPNTAQAGVGLEEGRAQGDQEEQEGVEALPLEWRLGMPEQFGAFEWPTWEEVFEASDHVYSETTGGGQHPGWRPNAQNAIGSAIGSAINHHVYEGQSDPIALAGQLIWRIQATQAAVDGNKRTGTVTGLAWLETQGYDTEPIPMDDTLFRTVDEASQMEPEAGAEYIAEYLRQYVVAGEGDYTSDPMGEDDDPNG